jgi:hypothetical protein
MDWEINGVLAKKQKRDTAPTKNNYPDNNPDEDAE